MLVESRIMQALFLTPFILENVCKVLEGACIGDKVYFPKSYIVGLANFQSLVTTEGCCLMDNMV
jgi:hypothetical protein